MFGLKTLKELDELLLQWPIACWASIHKYELPASEFETDCLTSWWCRQNLCIGDVFLLGIVDVGVDSASSSVLGILAFSLDDTCVVLDSLIISWWVPDLYEKHRVGLVRLADSRNLSEVFGQRVDIGYDNFERFLIMI